MSGDLILELRDPTLAVRRSVDLNNLLELKLLPRHNQLGAWTAKLVDSVDADLARQPGWGVVATVDDRVVLSGPVQAAEHTDKPGEPGTWSLAGFDDMVVVADAVAYPSPGSTDLTAQGGTAGSGYDKRSGTAEAVILGYVGANVGPSAPAARRATGLTLSTSLGRGGTGSWRARFDPLGELLEGIAKPRGLGFRVRQVGVGRLFEVYAPVDRSATLQFDTANDTADEVTYSYQAPALTRAIVGGGGAGAARALRERSNAGSLAAEALWGRRVEQFVDERDTTDTGELDQAGDQALADAGLTLVAAKLAPRDTAQTKFGRDYFLGDKVTVVVGDLPVAAVITEVEATWTPAGYAVAATVGDASAATRNPLLAQLRASRAQARRLGRLERRT